MTMRPAARSSAGKSVGTALLTWAVLLATTAGCAGSSSDAADAAFITQAGMTLAPCSFSTASALWGNLGRGRLGSGEALLVGRVVGGECRHDGAGPAHHGRVATILRAPAGLASQVGHVFGHSHGKEWIGEASGKGRRVVSDRRTKRIEINHTLVIYTDIRDRYAFFLKISGGFQYRAVLYLPD